MTTESKVSTKYASKSLKMSPKWQKELIGKGRTMYIRYILSIPSILSEVSVHPVQGVCLSKVSV